MKKQTNANQRSTFGGGGVVGYGAWIVTRAVVLKLGKEQVLFDWHRSAKRQNRKAHVSEFVS